MKATQIAAQYLMALETVGRDLPFGFTNPMKDYSRNSTPTSLSTINENKGLKKFFFEDGFSCWAINKKNAERKHKKHLNK